MTDANIIKLGTHHYVPIEFCRDLERLSRHLGFVSITDAWMGVETIVSDTAITKGWWDKPRTDAEVIALIHSELSEALEALRHGNPPDDKIPTFSGAEAELADVVIRIMDLAHYRGWDVIGAILAKIQYNQDRPSMHGKKF